MRMIWLAETLRDAGLEVAEKPGWRTRGRDSMVPQGVVAHHTGSGTPSSESAYADWLIKGRRDLPGPLSQLYLDRGGTYWVLAAGKANHAGRGGWRGLKGNSTVVGIEAGNDGRGEPWPDIQMDAYIRGTAAILKRIGRNADWVCGHKEWAPGRKPDPRGVDMNQFRRQVAVRLAENTVDIPPDRLTRDEIRKLRAHIASWESVGSIPESIQYLILDYRERQ